MNVPLIAIIWGLEGSCKTTVALSFPKPLRHFDIDVGGYKRAAWRLSPDELSQIISTSYPIPIQIEKMMGAQAQNGATIRFPKRVQGYKEAWQAIVVDFVKACQDPEVQTIVLDSGTMLWNICHNSLLQEKQEIQLSQKPGLQDWELREKLQPIEFPNDRMTSMIYTARSCGKNLVLTHYPKDVYGVRLDERGKKEEFKTGELDIDGFKHSLKSVDLVVWTELKEQYDPVVKARVTKLEAKIVKKAAWEGLGINALGLSIDPSYQGIINLSKAMKGE